MKASRFSDVQKAFILKQGADGVPVADICRKAAYLACKEKLDSIGLTHAACKILVDKPAPISNSPLCSFDR